MACFYLLMLVTLADLEPFNNFKTMAVKLLGDVELNPGPNEIIKSVQGSFSQGNVGLIWRNCYSSGCLQYFVFNLFINVIWYTCNWKKQAAQKMKFFIKDFFNKRDQLRIFWAVWDPDHILVEGDKSYE